MYLRVHLRLGQPWLEHARVFPFCGDSLLTKVSLIGVDASFETSTNGCRIRRAGGAGAASYGQLFMALKIC